MFFFFGALPIDQSKIKHTKKLKEIPSRHALENLLEKASIRAFIHLKLIGNLQGFCQYTLADMLNLSIYQFSNIQEKTSGVALLGAKNSFSVWFCNFPHTLTYQGWVENDISPLDYLGKGTFFL